MYADTGTNGAQRAVAWKAIESKWTPMAGVARTSGTARIRHEAASAATDRKNLIASPIHTTSVVRAALHRPWHMHPQVPIGDRSLSAKDTMKRPAATTTLPATSTDMSPFRSGLLNCKRRAGLP